MTVLPCVVAKNIGGEYTSTRRAGERMPKRALVAILSAGMAVCCGVSALACGDKLLVLGRGIRLEALLGNRTAKILAYQHAGTHGAELIADPEFQSALRGARYQLRVVRDTEELEVALRLGEYDLLLSDIADTNAIERTLKSAATPPAVIPILYQSSKADLALVEKRYRYNLKAPRKAGRNLSVIEQALETKLDTEAKLKRKHREAGGAS